MRSRLSRRRAQKVEIMTEKNRSWLKLITAVGGIAYVGSQLARHAKKIDLRGKVVAITGGSRGLGLALAQEFLGRGARVAVCGRDRETLVRGQELTRERTQHNLRIFECDITDEAAATRFIHDVEAHLGRIDVLVNNAGRIEVGPLEST